MIGLGDIILNHGTHNISDWSFIMGYIGVCKPEFHSSFLHLVFKFNCYL